MLCGLVMFGSAALGVLAVNEVKFYSIIKTQLVYALIGGAFAISLGIFIPYTWYKKYVYVLFGATILLTACVFVPGISFYHGGAHRWIHLGSLSLQPSEFLKFTTVVFVAYICAHYRNHFRDWRFGLLPYLTCIGSVSLLVLTQPDFGTYLVIAVSSFVTFFIGGARRKHIMTLFGLGLVGCITLIALRPYMLERVKTFLNNTHDPRGSSWQLNQSLIALGSGGLLGRGLGQSVQKFNYLPEPIGDSIYAVIGEELGFLGTLFILVLYGIVSMRGYHIFKRTPDQFGRLLAIGIVMIILTQASLNICSMLGIFPLTGVPLPLVSHGGTALMVALFELGVLLNISTTIEHNNYL